MRTAITIVSMLAGLSSAAAQDAGDPRLGLDVARESCATCHAILRVEDRSPNPNAPSFSHIAKVPGMTAMALHVALQSPHKTMPNVMLEPRAEGPDRVYSDTEGARITGVLTVKPKRIN